MVSERSGSKPRSALRNRAGPTSLTLRSNESDSDVSPTGKEKTQKLTPLPGNNLSPQSFEERFQDFLSRQTTPSQEVRLQIANIQKQFVDDKTENSPRSDQIVPEFRALLIHRFGSITSAWRQLFDPSQKGKVSHADFCHACRDMGYSRKLKKTWAALDTEKLGYIQLDSLDAEAAVAFREFRSLCRLKHGSLLKAWNWFDYGKKQRVELSDFVSRCQDLGLPPNVDSKKLFRWLKKDVARTYLTIQDFDESAMQCLYRDDDHMVSLKSRKSAATITPQMFASLTASQSEGDLTPIDERNQDCQSPPRFISTAPAGFRKSQSDPSLQRAGDETIRPRSAMACDLRRSSTINSRWLTNRSNKQLRERDEAAEIRKRLDKGVRSLEDLKHLLIVKFGSIYTAWREALDLDGNGRLSFGEFCMALRNIGFGGDVKDVWSVLEKADKEGDGFISLRGLDEQTHEAVNSYKEKAQESFGSMLGAWMECLDSHGSGQADEAKFTRHCKDLGWEGNPKLLFNNLKKDKSRTFLTLRDYDTQAFNAFQRGDMEMVSEDKSIRANIMEKSFHERQDMCFSKRWSRMQSKMDLKDLAKTKKDYLAKEKGATDTDSLRRMLVRKYGTITAAWKHGIDIYGNGRVPFGEFCASMRRQGFTGNIQQVFIELDSDKKGAITLADMDIAASQMLEDFRKLLLDKFDGSYIKAWAAMDSNRNGVLEENELVEECEKLGYDGDAKLLFKYLLDGPGKMGIHMVDLDPKATQAYYRGDVEAMSPQEKSKKLIEERKAREKAEQESRMGAHNWQALKKDLIRHYGSITAAWRNCLDASANGKVSFTEFSKSCRHMNFHGNVKDAFKELDDDKSGIITFNEVDPVWFARIQDFSEKLVVKYSSYESAWRALDSNGNNMLEEAELADVCKDLGFEACPSGELFRQLRLEKTQRYLTLEDLECKGIILAGVYTAGESSPSRHSSKGTPNASSSPTSQKFFAKRESQLLSPQEKAKADRKLIQDARKEMKDKQLAANNANSLKASFIRKYGSITAAWRYGLDFSGNGKVSFIEFSKACREIGFNGNIQEAFKGLNTSKTGIVTFDEMDHEWFQLLSSFRDLLQAKYGDLANSMKVFDKNGNNMIEVDELEAVCQDIGYIGEASELFKQLRANPTRRFITMDDIHAKGIIAWAAARQSEQNETTSPQNSEKKNAKDFRHQASRSSELSQTATPASKTNKRYFS